MKKLVLSALLLGTSSLFAGKFIEKESSKYMDLEVKYGFQDKNELLVHVRAVNNYKKAKGGVSLSIPTLKDSSLIKDKYTGFFKKVSSYEKGKKIWNKKLKKSVKAKYLLLEGWDNTWHKNAEKSFSIVVNTKSLNSLELQARANLISNKKKISIPGKAKEDQQGFSVKNISIDLKELLQKDKYVFYTESMVDGKDILYLENKNTKKRKKLLAREHISGGGFGCSFSTEVIYDENENMYARYTCEISQQYQEDILENSAIYKFSKGGELIKKSSY